MQKILKLVEGDLLRVEDEFRRNLQSRVELIPKVGEYVLLSGGKRLRPILLLMTAKVVQYNGNDHILLASVVEFIHTATLLHDDVVDNADLRRGMTSANSVWGNEASVLIGDFLYSKSFSMAVQCNSIKILKVLSDATTDMARGMVFELIKTNDINTTEEDYIQVIIDKTAVLIAAACQVGGILGEVDEERELALRDYGMNMGIAFQLMDDSMDYVSTEEDFGKTIGTDLQEGKVTLPVIKALNECTSEEKESISGLLDLDEINEDDLSLALDLINKYGGIDYTVQKARDYIARAKENIAVFEDSEMKEALLEMANYVVEREN
ncbi:MAG: polyprenyl synthetase family protein [Deltaproteobacteria bacterium]|nr:polyprenyl synthetase family protein [Deltaproteobacteria bacterium]